MLPWATFCIKPEREFGTPDKFWVTSPRVLSRCFCPQAIAHYEQAADYYKGEESNRLVKESRG